MGHITLKTEYSFGTCFGFLARTFNEYSDSGYIGIADTTTFGFYRLEVLCNAHNESAKDDERWQDKLSKMKNKVGSETDYREATARYIKPIYGLRVNVVKDATVKVKPRGQFGTEYIIIAKNNKGVSEIFELTSIASANFYYRELVSICDIEKLTDNVFVIPTDNIITNRADYYGLNLKSRVLRPLIKEKIASMGLKLVVVDNNFYPTKEDKGVYECYSGRNSDIRTVSQHILDEGEKRYYYPKEAIDNIEVIASQCEHYQLEKAEVAKSVKGENIEDLIVEGAKKKHIDLSTDPYKSRIKRELDIIKQKGFVEYFLIVGDIIRFAKQKSLVGPGRGSSAGSLVCYLLDITDVDPIKYKLIFERFIDINRMGEPDIDSDFSDSYRGKVIGHIEKTYGKDKVKTISNISTYAPKIALGEFAHALKIPEWEVNEVKDSIIERAGGDNRASFCIADTFEQTEPGKRLLEKYPEIAIVSKIEGHSKNKGKHAAGVIVSNEPLYNFCGINNRDDSVHLNKKDAEGLNILKIDILGLRTLSVLESVAELAGFDFNDYFKIDLEDKEVYDNIFKKGRLSGIFQFEGSTMKSLNKDAPMSCFEDIACAQALARPGALASGGAAKFVEIKNGRREPKYYCKKHEEITKDTYGITVFQESMMWIAKEIGCLSWEDVSYLRIAASKSYGDEWFAKFKPKFINGCIEGSGLTEEVAEEIWKDIASSGSYSFNRSHAVSYGFMSFWVAWAKHYYPLEFVASILNHSKTDKDSLKVLREFYTNEGLEYESVDPDESEVHWSIKDGKLLGGLMNINGFGIKKCREIIKMRKGEIPFTVGIMNTMFDPKTPYDVLFPCDFHWYDLYNRPTYYTDETLPISYIEDVHEKGEYWVLGQLIKFDDINLNDYVHVQKRGYEFQDNTKKVTFKIEDDTDGITIIIERKKYDKLASVVLESKIDSTYLLVKGEIIFDNARVFMASQIANLNKQLELQPYDKKFSKIKRARQWKGAQ